MSENIRGITFAEQSVTPADDAIVRRAMLGDGVLTGCDVTYSGSTLTLASGYIIACGRSFQITAAQNFAVVDATSGVARLLLTIDLTKTATENSFDQIGFSIEYASAEDGFVDLVKDDINLSGTKYQIVCAVVSLGTGGITGIISKLERTEGGGLNFKVVPGLTQPGTAAENTIWVKTEKIGAWYFSATQPEEPQEWDVWIQTGASSFIEFNALKKNGIQVYPLSAKQYVSGKWVDKTAKSYQNGEWVDWRVYLYNAGNEFIDITGGWGGYPNAKYDYFYPIKKSDYIELKGVAGNNYGYGGTSKKIVPGNTLYVEMSVTNYNEQSYFGVATNAYDCLESYIAKVEISSNSNRTVYSLPLDGVTEPVYVTFTSGGDTLLTIYKVWME